MGSAYFEIISVKLVDPAMIGVHVAKEIPGIFRHAGIHEIPYSLFLNIPKGNGV